MILRWFGCAGFAFLLAGFAAEKSAPEWRVYGGDEGGTHYSPLDQINVENVSKLKRAWTFHTGEVAPDGDVGPRQRRTAFECTPLVIDGVMYLTTPTSRAIALDAETGKMLWQFDPYANRTGVKPSHPSRGMAMWSGPNGEQRLFYGTADGQLICLNPKFGKPIPGFAREGFLDLRQGVADRWPKLEYHMTSPPAIYKNLVITGAAVPEGVPAGPSGAVRAFDVKTGRLAWEFQTVPRPGQKGSETWEGEGWKDRTGANVWSMMSVDHERGMVFLPIGSPSYDFYGGDRPGQDLYGNSLVALDAKTGRLLWHYQFVHHDLWDYDPPAQPILVTVHQGGRAIPAVVQVTKMGFVFVLDRTTGRPLFPVEERPVPKSDVPGEQSWPTQPFPVKPPQLSRNTITREELNTLTPATREYCEALFDSLTNKGMFTPYGMKPTLVMPGTLGGATWSGGAFDPLSGWLYVNTNEMGAVGQMKAQPEGSPTPYRRTSPRGDYARFWDEQSVPCQQPPWGNLTAVNLNTGDIAWKVPLGQMPGVATKDGTATGAPNIGGGIVTAGGLVFIASTMDHKFRAFDARTGKLAWEADLEASGHATPATYLGKRTGKQFVAIAAGGGGFFPGPMSDVVAAYALAGQ